MRAKNPFTPGQLTGGLLAAASGVLAASTIPGSPAVAESIGIALVGAGVAATAELHLRARRFGLGLLALAVVAIGDRVAEQALATTPARPWVIPAALGAYLLWTAAFAAPRSVLRAAIPALVAVAIPLALRASATDALVWSAVLVPVTLLAMVLATPGARARAARDEIASNLADLDAVVLANLELRHTAEASDAARRTARIATELLHADGAVVWVRGPGRLLCAGGHGTTPAPEKEMPSDPVIDSVLVSGSVHVGDDGDVVLPLTASGGVFGAVAVSGATRPTESFVSSVLQVFGAQAGYALERLRTVESLIDVRFVDPVTGVGNRQAATASLATLRPGDAVLLLALDDLERIRVEQGDARADLTLGQLGLHLRTGTRAGDLVARFADDVFFILLRDLSSSAESVVTRLIESWHDNGAAGRLRAGAALHFADTTPLDTLDRATEALDAGSDRRPLSVAAEYAAWGPTD